MIAVPLAALLPSVPRPIRRSNSPISSRGNPFGNTGNARSSTRPINSQCPVTESLPGEDSAIRPNAPIGSGSSGRRLTVETRVKTEPAQIRDGSGIRREMLPSVSLPVSP